MSKPLEYIVRSFDPVIESNFDCTGTIDKLVTLKEETVSNQLSAFRIIINGNHSMNAISSNQNALGADVASIVVDTSLTTRGDVRNYQNTVKGLINTWAEKSRVKESRGFRSNAIKTPRFKMSDNFQYQLIFEVILSSAIFYNQDTAKISTNNFKTDLAQFKKQLEKEIGPVRIKCDHHELGVFNL